MGSVRLFFLGVVASVYFRQDINQVQIVPVPTTDMSVVVSKQMINLGLVFKASTIVEAIKACLQSKGIDME